jgi:hypothetical protein
LRLRDADLTSERIDPEIAEKGLREVEPECVVELRIQHVEGIVGCIRAVVEKQIEVSATGKTLLQSGIPEVIVAGHRGVWPTAQKAGNGDGAGGEAGAGRGPGLVLALGAFKPN